MVVSRTASWCRYRHNWATIDGLMDIRKSSRPMSHSQRAALNQAAMVFMISVWEAYVEDVAQELADHIALYTRSFDALPKRLETIITDGMIAKGKPKWLPRDIAGDGWREIVSANARQKCSILNTPNMENVNALIYDTTGYADIAETWRWQGASIGGPAQLLDQTIDIRGGIVHTAQKPPELNANWITTYGGNINRLVDRTDRALFRYGMSFGMMINFAGASIESARAWLNPESDGSTEDNSDAGDR